MICAFKPHDLVIFTSQRMVFLGTFKFINQLLNYEGASYLTFENAAHITDADLLGAISDNDEAALLELYNRYRTILFGLLIRILRNRAEAEDVLQEIFVQIWQRAGNFDERRGKAFTWLVTLTRSRAIDRLRSLKVQAQFFEEPTVSKSFYSDLKFEQNMVVHERAQLVRRALDQIPESQRNLLLMAYFEGYSQSEIANQTNLPLGTVKTRIRSALTQLRKTLVKPL